MNQDTNGRDAAGGAAKAPLTEGAADLFEPLDAALAAQMREDA